MKIQAMLRGASSREALAKSFSEKARELLKELATST